MGVQNTEERGSDQQIGIPWGTPFPSPLNRNRNKSSGLTLFFWELSLKTAAEEEESRRLCSNFVKMSFGSHWRLSPVEETSEQANVFQSATATSTVCH